LAGKKILTRASFFLFVDETNNIYGGWRTVAAPFSDMEMQKEKKKLLMM
jgi:hypothetical protein